MPESRKLKSDHRSHVNCNMAYAPSAMAWTWDVAEWLNLPGRVGIVAAESIGEPGTQLTYGRSIQVVLLPVPTSQLVCRAGRAV